MPVTASISETQRIVAQVRSSNQIVPIKATVGTTGALEGLDNVSLPNNAETNSTLVYDAETGIFTTKKLNLDGGIF